MAQYVKRPVLVDAVQWTGRNAEEIETFVGRIVTGQAGFHVYNPGHSFRAQLFVAANEAWLWVDADDWIIRYAKGCYPCKPDIFAQTYQPALDHIVDAHRTA